ncbi:GDP-mannose pyrophosphatase NudK [Cycloclasticus sp.]|uniref:GDP-mannose pyrophosphatase NudK n=1 Tax=Cycloclasticus sp. TaxID=2024830 RepID=UPI00257E9611|nr:GDP-mannose pyrophosphatase NudK [Cycloclasticus sp.]
MSNSQINIYTPPDIMIQSIKNLSKKLLSDNWYTLNKYTFDFQKENGQWEQHQREVYDRGNGATVLLYSAAKQSVILTRQFRLPSYLNGNNDGLLIETCAGLLDGDEPEICIKKEIEEETGYSVKTVKKIFQAYMSPGAVTEILHFFIAEYTPQMKISEGGGLAHEQENIEVLELNFEAAYQMIATGDIVDAKTIILLQYAKLNQLCL